VTSEQQQLFDSHLGLAREIARGFTIPGGSYSFVEQEALLGLEQAVRKFDPARGGFRPFCRMVINNRLKSAYQDAIKWQRDLTILDAEPADLEGAETLKDSLCDPDPIPSHEAERNHIRQVLDEELAKLTPQQQAVVTQKALGASFAEIARATGATEQAVGQMHKRAINQLRPQLEYRRIRVQFMPGARFKYAPSVQKPPSEDSPPKDKLSWVILLTIIIGLLIWIFFEIIFRGTFIFAESFSKGG
jgi:RNA polymerase sigma factor (sigma-70 family)